MTTIGLCMIVKDEASVILRCLRSVRSLIDYVLLVDTGSTDGTEAIVTQYLAEEDLPGEIVAQPWRDFAYNRSFALAKLREKANIGYALVVDADDTLVFSPGFDANTFKKGLDRDFYTTEIRQDQTRFWRAQILNNRVKFSYKGILHEFLVAPAAASSGVATGLFIQAGADGVRSGNPLKYRDDAWMLQKALETETDEFIRARYTFYLAQSWMNAGEKKRALLAFLRRAELGFWNEEVCLSLWYAAQIKDALGYPDTDVIGTYLKAYEVNPQRAEPLHGAMDYCRRNNRPHESYLIGKHALTLAEPLGRLFVAPWIYDYGVLEEFSVAAYLSGHYQESLGAIEKLLADRKIPEEARPRLEENARIAAAKLSDAGIAAT
jgi:glycosyltransferase involved in cell wall biosynthesis